MTVKAEQVPLGELLDALVAISPLKLRLDPADRSLPVSVEAEDVSPIDAMWLVLKASELDFVMSSRGIVAGRAAKATEEGARVEDRTQSEGKLEAPAPAAIVEPPPPSIDEHLLPRIAVEIPPPAPPAVMELPKEAIAEEPTVEEPIRVDLSKRVEPPAADQFSREVGVGHVPFILREDSVIITQPGFVPYKLRPDVQRRRLLTNVADIP